MSDPKPKRILVYRVGHLGDTIVALPAFWALRKAFPDAHLGYLCNAPTRSEDQDQAVPSVSVLPSEGLFDSYVGYGQVSGGFRGGFDMLDALRRIRKGGFDTLFYLMTRNRPVSSIRRDEVFFRLCGIRKVFGTADLKENVLGFGEARPLPDVGRESEFLLESLRRSGVEVSISPETIDDVLAITPSEGVFASEWLRTNIGQETKGGILLGVGPGSKWDSKVWPEERFIETVAKLIEEKNVFPLVFGGPEDAEKAERLVESWGKGASAAGILNVRQAGAVLKHCRLYLGNDTGTMHLAAAAGVRCVAVFAAVDYPGRWAPLGAGHTILRVKVPCEGCHSPVCDKEALCLRSIEVETVVSACLDQLNE